eukprot:297382-Chlamydomonas_euryale.AAC.1
MVRVQLRVSSGCAPGRLLHDKGPGQWQKKSRNRDLCHLVSRYCSILTVNWAVRGVCVDCRVGCAPLSGSPCNGRRARELKERAAVISHGA